jgi:uncharacterized protein YndB with AHSA1/START domain
MTEGNGFWLRMTRLLSGSRPDIWRAMTDPAELARWWGPHGFTTPSIEFEPRIGGSYRIAMRPAEGEVFHLDGEFREVDPPSRIAYTFRWDPPAPDDRETLVTLSLRERGKQTEVELAQGEFATQERLELHDSGWNDSFEKLEGLLG